MKFNFLLAIFLAIGNKCGFSEAKISEKDAKITEAKEAKTEYNTFRAREGLRRLKDAFPEEKKLGRILQWFLFEQICLTKSTAASNSCYAMSDFSIEPSANWNKFENWLSAPYSNDREPSLQWYERLYNSIAFMLLNHNGDEITLTLGTKSGHGVGEMDCLPVNVDIGIGNTKTFRKGFITGEKINKTIKLNILESFNDMKKAVKNVLGMIEDAYDKYLTKISE